MCRSVGNTEPEPSGVAVNGREIRRRRKLQGKYLADFATECGISQQYLSFIETGARKTVSPPVFARICDALHVEDRNELLAEAGVA